jgi:hypothetical protein
MKCESRDSVRFTRLAKSKPKAKVTLECNVPPGFTMKDLKRLLNVALSLDKRALPTDVHGAEGEEGIARALSFRVIRAERL